MLRHRFTPFVLLASAQSCTWTTDDFSPGTVPVEPEGTPPNTSMTGAPPAPDAGASDDPGAGVMTEGPAPDMVVGNDDGDDPGNVSVEPDAGAPDGGNAPPVAVLPALVGWAGVEGLGLPTTTGGGATPALLVETAEELIALAARPEPLTLAIAGTLDVGRLDLSSDKTLFGTNENATLRGGIAIRGTPESFVRNVIVHNLNIDAVTSTIEGDGIEVRYAHHVWIDHCEIKDAADGLIDIVRGSDFLTVSRTRFLYTAAAPDPAHRFAALVGHDVANAAEDQGHLNVTWHHNWWSDDVARALLGRFGSIHLFNNLFSSAGNDTVLNADVSARLLVENNVFAGVTSPHTIVMGSGASVEAPGNVYVDSTGPRDVAGTTFVPPYAYQLESALAALASGDVGPR
jgi:pectate lyase